MKHRLTALALVLALLSLIPAVLAAPAIDSQKPCSITVQVDGELGEDLKTIPEIPVKFYKVAQLNREGMFVVTPEFHSLDLNQSREGFDWQEIAGEAALLVSARDSAIQPSYQQSILLGSFTKMPAEHGLYLVAVDDAESESYGYSFSPYLISLPDNLFYHVKDAEDDGSAPDAWVYDVTVGLKPQRKDRLGKLIIQKDLSNFQQINGVAIFAFQIEAEKLSPITQKMETVFSTVTAIHFRGDGSQTAEIEGIPVGATVTVKEVYSGSAYENTGLKSYTFVMGEAEGEAGEVPSHTVVFENRGTDRFIEGNGVINRFQKDENDGWHWTQPD